MPTNLITQCNPSSGTSAGVTYTWNNPNCHAQGTSTGTSFSTITQGDVTLSPFRANYTYELKGATSALRLQWYSYPAMSGTYDQTGYFTSDGELTIPANCVRFWLRLRVNNGTTVNVTRTIEAYDITYTDVDADVQMMQDHLGYPNSWFNANAWEDFANPPPWDGESCSEIACCISYLAGNLSTIFVSNYAEGLWRLFDNAGRYYTRTQGGQVGDFIWWDYDFDGIPDHTGRIMAIDPDGTIHTFEGNVTSVTITRPFSPNDPTIFGFGRPDYRYAPSPTPHPTPANFQPNIYVRHMRRLRGMK